MTAVERKKIEEALKAYEVAVSMCRKMGRSVPPEVLASVEVLRQQLREG